jgi:Phosphoesterase family
MGVLRGFVKKIVDAVQANRKLWAETAIFITFDEGGGYYDSGYVQPLDFFGDGTRIPMIVVSPYSRGGHVSHTYTDHVSTAKFIERNWHLRPITRRSRDNLPNPVTRDDNPMCRSTRQRSAICSISSTSAGVTTAGEPIAPRGGPRARAVRRARAATCGRSTPSR